MARKLFSKDLYAVLGVKEDATEKEIVKGYRKKALKCHPDKNPDNPKAAEQFHELSEALKVLTDAAARAAYDQSRKAKQAVIARNKVLDSKRKKFKEDLEAREQAFFEESQRQKETLTEEKLAAEIARLKKEGSRLLEQEQARLREELKKQTPEEQQDSDGEETLAETPRVKLKWKAAKGDPDNGGYAADFLKTLLECYGSISALVMSAKRNGSAIVEFDKSRGVSYDILEETGRSENPLSMIWLSGKPEPETSSSSYTAPTLSGLDGAPVFADNSDNIMSKAGDGVEFVTGSSSGAEPAPTSSSEKDFESLVLMKMRQAEERKRLIEQMMKEDGDG